MKQLNSCPMQNSLTETRFKWTTYINAQRTCAYQRFHLASEPALANIDIFFFQSAPSFPKHHSLSFQPLKKLNQCFRLLKFTIEESKPYFGEVTGRPPLLSVLDVAEREFCLSLTFTLCPERGLITSHA